MLLAVSLLIFGCSAPPDGGNGNGNDTNGQGSTEPVERVKVALLLVTPINDGGWSESSYNGFVDAQNELGFEAAYTESLELPDMESAIRDYAERDFDIIVMSSANFSEVATLVAPDYPDVRFVIINGETALEPNLANFRPATVETGFLAGAAAGLLTESNIIGKIGGSPRPPVQDAFTGFLAGAEYVNPGVNVLTSYLDSWTDIAKGTEAAIAMIESGADVLLGNASSAGFGVIDAAKNEGIIAVGYITDQYEVAPGTIPFSAIQFVGGAVHAGIRAAMTDDFRPESVWVGAAEGLVKMSPFYDIYGEPVPQEIQDKLAEIYQGLVDGSLEAQGILPESGFAD